MIIYNVTVNVEEDIHDEWIEWMKTKHIPDVMNTGCFKTYRMFRLITRQQGETGITYAIQYEADSWDDYDRYRLQYAPALQKEHAEKFEGKFYAFRTLLETV